MKTVKDTITLTPTSLDYYYRLVEALLPYSYYQYAISENPTLKAEDAAFYCYKAIDLDTHNDIGIVVCYKPKDQNTLWIQTLIVFEGYKRQKYGTIIVEKLISLFISASDISAAYLTCYKKNTAGLAFWKTLQFHEISIANTNKLNHSLVLKRLIIRSKP